MIELFRAKHDRSAGQDWLYEEIRVRYVNFQVGPITGYLRLNLDIATGPRLG